MEAHLLIYGGSLCMMCYASVCISVLVQAQAMTHV